MKTWSITQTESKPTSSARLGGCERRHRPLRVVSADAPEVRFELAGGRIPDSTEHHRRVDLGYVLEREPAPRRVPRRYPCGHGDDAVGGDVYIHRQKLALPDTVLQLVLKHLLVVVAEADDPRPLRAA